MHPMRSQFIRTTISTSRAIIPLAGIVASKNFGEMAVPIRFFPPSENNNPYGSPILTNNGTGTFQKQISGSDTDLHVSLNQGI